MRLDGVRALVTGASRGLGRAVAQGFAAEGARLVLTATDPRHLDAALAAVRGRGGEAHGVALDLADPASCAAAAGEALGALGRLDVLVNNAGLLGDRAELADIRMDVFDRVMAVNVAGTLRLTQAVLPGMADGGAIINVTSGAAARATWGAYAVSKQALDGITSMLRVELAPRAIRCVGVDPGGLRTAMRAAAYPDEDPATLPRPESVVPVFVAIAEGADPGPRVDARDGAPR